MRTTFVFFAAVLALVGSRSANAQVDNGNFSDGRGSAPANLDSEHVPGLGMRQPTYGGSGCPQGTVSAVISPDQRTLSVLFDNYIARAALGRTRHAVDCAINIPFDVPPGYRVQVVKMDYRGFTSVPAGARSTFGAGYRFLEINGQPVDEKRVMRAKVFVGPREENFTISSDIRGAHWSPCGQRFTLQTESRILAQTNTAGQEVLTTVDSLDAVAQPAVYYLRWQRCSVHGDRSGDLSGGRNGSGRVERPLPPSRSPVHRLPPGTSLLPRRY